MIAIPQDDTQAAYWYRKAVDQGYAEAQLNLGRAYTNVQGVPKDDAQAVYWLHKAADQGNALAQFGLGMKYGQCAGVTKDSVIALMWVYVSYVYSEGTPFQEKVVEMINNLTTHFTEQQITEAQQRAKIWIAAHPKKN
ncbi:tetratricopeptide repeat protein [Candidatus Contendibacter odensensis]|uniref:Sel1 repeat family protein n=1 Tax=Candidatus Contendobacter odensis Run_B_J11 TaxID=1400861 RepID=A0A7U7GEF5_9GAMM|nr:tetratricopeptide repeat protein [Candidatus Contendobacter odensis]CDH46827.1 hypothetical protein BN874_610038 [Candidatus Contendobacter odensis Run_B_J11]